MPTDEDLEDLCSNNMTGSNMTTFFVALMDAVDEGHEGEQRLIEALATVNKRGYRTALVAALGECTGPLGEQRLRECVTESSRDVRGMALQSLARRARAGALPDLLSGLADRDGMVRLMAATCLAVVASSHDWDRIFGSLPRRSSPGKGVSGRGKRETLTTLVGTLIRYIDGDTDRGRRLAEYINKNQGSLTDEMQVWLADSWPTVLADEASYDSLPATTDAPLALMDGVSRILTNPNPNYVGFS